MLLNLCDLFRTQPWLSQRFQTFLDFGGALLKHELPGPFDLLLDGVDLLLLDSLCFGHWLELGHWHTVHLVQRQRLLLETWGAGSWNLTCYIINELHLRVSPDWIAHLNHRVGGSFRAMDVLEFDSGGHFFGMAVDSHDLTELIEVGVDLDDVKFVLGHVFNVD